VEFNVNANGKTKNVQIALAEPQDSFRKSALAYIKSLRCDVPPDWVTSGATNHRFRVSIVFELYPGGVIQPIRPNDAEFVFQIRN
jgi:outer membrane biosynthesis protein TonB